MSLQHCTGHIMMCSFMGRENQYIQLVKVLYCKWLTIRKQQPTFPHGVQGLNHSPQRREIGRLTDIQTTDLRGGKVVD